MTLNEKIIDEVTDFIKNKVAAELGIKPGTQVNANDVIPKMEYLPFVDLGQMDDVRFMIDKWDDEYDQSIEDAFPEIAKTLYDPNKKGCFAATMWHVLVKNNSYELNDEVKGMSNLSDFLNDVNDYLKDLD